MGGGLTFLNKKTWHPGRMQNQEEKWKREQAAEKEAKKLAEIRTQIEQERQHEELHQVAIAAGVKDQADRLDWMYQGGMVGMQEANKRAEEQLLGVRPVELAEPAEPSKAESLAQLPTFYAEDTPASANELWSRLHSDPLFAIRQQEIVARRAIAKNPVKMDAIKREVAMAKAQHADPAAGAKQDKAARKEARREVKRAQREAEIAAARAVLAAARAKGAAAAAAANPAPDPAAERGGKRRRRDEGDHDRDGGDHRAKHGGSHARDGSDHRTERRDRSGEHSGRHANGKAADGGVERDGARNGGAEPRVHHDAASAQGRDLRYGLNHADAVQGYDRSDLAAATRQRLMEAVKKNEAEEREKAAQRYTRTEYKTGQLTAEERAARLAEMAGNAGVHEEARWSRLRNAKAADAAEEAAAEAALQARTSADAPRLAPSAARSTPEQPLTDDLAQARAGRAGADRAGAHHADTAGFLQAATREVYGAAGAGSLAERVGRQKFYADRGGEAAAAFRR